MAKRKASKTKAAKVAVKAAPKSPVKTGKKLKPAAAGRNGSHSASDKQSAGVEASAVEANGSPAIAESVAANTNGQMVSATERQRFLPLGGELKSLYARYYNCSTFDDHDKAFYFVLDVGGINRARQLLTHVEEVLAELEEFQG